MADRQLILMAFPTGTVLGQVIGDVPVGVLKISAVSLLYFVHVRACIPSAHELAAMVVAEAIEGCIWVDRAYNVIMTIQCLKTCYNNSRMNAGKKFTVRELGELAGVSVRRIRYFIQEGLLDRPVGTTKASYYTQGHLLDLLEIRRLMEDKGLRIDRVQQVMSARKSGEQDKAGESDDELFKVWTHVRLSRGILLLIEPKEASIATEDIRGFVRKVAAAYKETIEHKDKSNKGDTP